MGSYNQNKNFDSLLLQTLMGRLQNFNLRPSYLNTNSFLSQTFEDFLLQEEEQEEENDEAGGKTQLAREESRLEREIIRIILTGNTDSLKPNSGQAVTVSGEHHVCVGYHVEPDSDYRVWEWHGHIMLFDEENGYNPEYIYGNYFERVQIKADEEKGDAKEKEVGNLGLLELIGEVVGNGGSGNSRILRRNMTTGSPR